MSAIRPTAKPAPARGGTAEGRAIGTIHNDALPIFIHEPVLEEILQFSERDLTREIGGFLVGGVHHDQRDYVEVRHFLPAVDARSGVASLKFTHETWSAMTREVDEQCPGEVVVGWHHTHPKLGIFLSGYDEFIHKNFFRERWQIALVVDPIQHEFGFFQWRGGEVVDCGFVCVFEK